MAPTGSLELYQSLMKWLRTFPTTKDEADVTDGVDMAKVNTKIEIQEKREKGNRTAVWESQVEKKLQTREGGVSLPETCVSTSGYPPQVGGG